MNERERSRLEDDTWFQGHFFDPDHPIDSDWLHDAELGRLFLNETQWNISAKRLSVNEAIMKEAKAYMDARGLAVQYRPRLVEFNEHVYAVRPNGDDIRLDHSLLWEKECGFEDMVDGQLKKMYSSQYLAPNKVIMPVVD